MDQKNTYQTNNYSNKATGNKGEIIAANYLLEKGYQLLEKNWRHHHLEIDIIAAKNGFLHIVEVKTRYSLRFGRPEESITKEKMKFLKNAAEAYQYKNPQWKYLQFDVIAITLVNQVAQEIFMIEDVYF